MRYHRTLLLTTMLTALCACQSVRTVYDANGQAVKETDGATISDLNSRFEKEFQSSFSERKTDSGVPQTSSNKVSSFQKYLDESRKIDSEYRTRSYDGLKRDDSRSVAYAGASADTRYARDNDRREKDSTIAYGSDMRPDFMNETHGISHAHRYSSDHTHRSSMDGLAAPGYRGTVYDTSADSGYNRNNPDWYVEDRREKTPQPTITGYREYYRKTIMDTRSLLGRDKKPDE